MLSQYSVLSRAYKNHTNQNLHNRRGQWRGAQRGTSFASMAFVSLCAKSAEGEAYVHTGYNAVGVGSAVGLLGVNMENRKASVKLAEARLFVIMASTAIAARSVQGWFRVCVCVCVGYVSK